MLYISGGRKFSLGGLSINIVHENFRPRLLNQSLKLMHAHKGGISPYSEKKGWQNNVHDVQLSSLF